MSKWEDQCTELQTVELQAAEFVADIEGHCKRALNCWSNITVVVDGQPTLHISSVPLVGRVRALLAQDLRRNVSDVALLVALHGHQYRVPLPGLTVYISRAPGYYSNFLDSWARAWGL